MSELVKTENHEVELIMSREKALELTSDIQSTTSALYVLLKQAHDDKAWVALGYKSWASYVEGEFDFSRARSYQLINQANVIAEINEASGVPLYITEREARAIKKRLPEITEKLEKGVKDADLEQEEAEAKAREILDGIHDEDKDIDNADYETDNEEPSPIVVEGEEEVEQYRAPEDNRTKRHLNDDELFYLENLLITLRIFESMPDASEFGKTIKESTYGTKELSKLSENAFAWITQLLDEIE